MKFHERFFNTRDSKFVTKTELAQHLSTSRQQILKYENGVSVPSADVLLKIADYLGVSTDYLLGRDNFAMVDKSNNQKHLPIPNELTDEDFELLREMAHFLQKKRLKKK